jgi:hypothetical protein
VLQGSVLAHEHISYIRLRAKKYWGKNSKCGREEKSNLRTLNIEEALDIKTLNIEEALDIKTLNDC